MKKIKIVIIICACFGFMRVAQCQTDEKSKALQELKTISEKYKSSSYLSFDMLYRYALENKPGVYLDTLKGSYKLNGSEYIYMLDNTEVINTKAYSIMLFKEDKIMYLTKASGNNKSSNPIALLDSFFQNNKQFSCSITEQKGIKIISLVFQPGSPYKKMEYYSDSKTGYITKAVYWVKSDQLYDPSVQNLVDKTAGYAVVEVIFNHYRQGTFGQNEFDAGRYFKLQGNEYTTVSPFESYKIFLGNSNL